ncbi:TPA: hypothetical protein ACGO9P_001937 [Streptococcus suis]
MTKWSPYTVTFWMIFLVCPFKPIAILSTQHFFASNLINSAHFYQQSYQLSTFLPAILSTHLAISSTY